MAMSVRLSAQSVHIVWAKGPKFNLSWAESPKFDSQDTFFFLSLCQSWLSGVCFFARRLQYLVVKSTATSVKTIKVWSTNAVSAEYIIFILFLLLSYLQLSDFTTDWDFYAMHVVVGLVLSPRIN